MSLHQVQSTAVKKYSLKQLKIAERLVVSFANLDLSWVPDRKDICCPQFSCYWCIFFNVFFLIVEIPWSTGVSSGVVMSLFGKKW